MDLDGILSDVGEFGRYQKLVLWFILVPGVFPCGFHAYNQLFMAANAEHWCRIPELEHLDLEIAKNISIPLEEKDGKWTYSQCLMYDKNYTDISDLFEEIGNFTTPQKVPCRNGWVYDRSQHKNSVTMEWNLVCAKDISATLALVLLGLGGLVGNYIFGYVQDGLGRKPSFFIYLFIQSVFGIATAFASNFFMWSIFRIGVGFTVPAILATPCVLEPANHPVNRSASILIAIFAWSASEHDSPRPLIQILWYLIAVSLSCWRN